MPSEGGEAGTSGMKSASKIPQVIKNVSGEDLGPLPLEEIQEMWASGNGQRRQDCSSAGICASVNSSSAEVVHSHMQIRTQGQRQADKKEMEKAVEQLVASIKRDAASRSAVSDSLSPIFPSYSSCSMVVSNPYSESQPQAYSTSTSTFSQPTPSWHSSQHVNFSSFTTSTMTSFLNPHLFPQSRSGIDRENSTHESYNATPSASFTTFSYPTPPPSNPSADFFLPTLRFTKTRESSASVVGQNDGTSTPRNSFVSDLYQSKLLSHAVKPSTGITYSQNVSSFLTPRNTSHTIFRLAPSTLLTSPITSVSNSTAILQNHQLHSSVNFCTQSCSAHSKVSYASKNPPVNVSSAAYCSITNSTAVVTPHVITASSMPITSIPVCCSEHSSSLKAMQSCIFTPSLVHSPGGNSSSEKKIPYRIAPSILPPVPPPEDDSNSHSLPALPISHQSKPMVFNDPFAPYPDFQRSFTGSTFLSQDPCCISSASTSNEISRPFVSKPQTSNFCRTREQSISRLSPIIPGTDRFPEIRAFSVSGSSMASMLTPIKLQYPVRTQSLNNSCRSGRNASNTVYPDISKRSNGVASPPDVDNVVSKHYRMFKEQISSVSSTDPLHVPFPVTSSTHDKVRTIIDNNIDDMELDDSETSEESTSKEILESQAAGQATVVVSAPADPFITENKPKRGRVKPMPCSLEFPNMDDFDFGKINKLNMGTTRAHLCDQTKVVIGRVLAYNREMSRRLGVFKRHTPFISPERLTAQQTGFSLTTIRNCSDDRLVVGKCTDRPNTKSAEEVRREQRREELADIFADETWCELPKSYRKDVNEFEKQNVRRSQRVRKLRSGLKRRWADTTEGETTILDDSIGSHDFQSSQQK